MVFGEGQSGIALENLDRKHPGTGYVAPDAFVWGGAQRAIELPGATKELKRSILPHAPLRFAQGSRGGRMRPPLHDQCAGAGWGVACVLEPGLEKFTFGASRDPSEAVK